VLANLIIHNSYIVHDSLGQVVQCGVCTVRGLDIWSNMCVAAKMRERRLSTVLDELKRDLLSLGTIKASQVVVLNENSVVVS